MAQTIKFEWFLDRPKVVNRLTAAERRYLMRVGGAYRLTVKRSMRSGKGTKRRPDRHAPPGKPPLYHTKLLRDNIFFQYDQQRHNVVVGARKLNGTTGQVPRILEFGGRAEGSRGVFRKLRDARGKYTGQVQRVGSESFPYTMRPRPFVGQRSINWPIALDIMRKHRTLLW